MNKIVTLGYGAGVCVEQEGIKKSFVIAEQKIAFKKESIKVDFTMCPMRLKFTIKAYK